MKSKHKIKWRRNIPIVDPHFGPGLFGILDHILTTF